MKKLKPIDIFGYNAEEFDEWWKESAKKMEKRTMRKFGSEGDGRLWLPRESANTAVADPAIWKLGINSDRFK